MNPNFTKTFKRIALTVNQRIPPPPKSHRQCEFDLHSTHTHSLLLFVVSGRWNPSRCGVVLNTIQTTERPILIKSRYCWTWLPWLHRIILQPEQSGVILRKTYVLARYLLRRLERYFSVLFLLATRFYSTQSSSVWSCCHWLEQILAHTVHWFWPNGHKISQKYSLFD